MKVNIPYMDAMGYDISPFHQAFKNRSAGLVSRTHPFHSQASNSNNRPKHRSIWKRNCCLWLAPIRFQAMSTRKLPKSIVWNRVIPKISPTGPTEGTPKPEYLISRSQLTFSGSVGKVLFNFWWIITLVTSLPPWNPLKPTLARKMMVGRRCFPFGGSGLFLGLLLLAFREDNINTLYWYTYPYHPCNGIFTYI